MYTDNREAKIVNIEHETESAVIWIDRERLTDGRINANCIPVAPWGDADTLVRAAKVMARMAWN